MKLIYEKEKQFPYQSGDILILGTEEVQETIFLNKVEADNCQLFFATYLDGYGAFGIDDGMLHFTSMEGLIDFIERSYPIYKHISKEEYFMNLSKWEDE